VIKKPRNDEAKARYRAVENTTMMDCNARKTNIYDPLKDYLLTPVLVACQTYRPFHTPTSLTFHIVTYLCSNYKLTADSPEVLTA
jgi:hypothetical protein